MVEDAISGAKTSPCLLAQAVIHLPLCLWQGDRLVHSRLALLWYSLNPLFCEWARLCLRLELFMGKFSLSLSLSLFFPSLWLFHSLGCYLILAPSDCLQAFRPGPYPKHATHTSLFSPCWMVADVSFGATSPLGVVVRYVFCACVCVFPLLPVMLLSEILKLPTDLPVRGFPGVWKLLLLHDSFPRTGLHP